MLDIKITRTAAPKAKPTDETKLGFGKKFSDHMFVMDYTEGEGWHDARIVPYGPFELDPATVVFHYAQEIFEGMKAYRTADDTVQLFRPDCNAKRFQDSADRLCIPKIPVEDYIQAVEALVDVDRDWVPHTDGNNTLSDKDEKEQDPQYSDNDGAMNQSAGNGASVILSNSTNETSDITIGVDVSKFQGTIDWAQAASSGVDFAMIRVGYRAQKTGVIYADTNAKYNMQQAAANGIKVGVYFFSSAVNEAEAIEEADWVADFIADYSITYPVAFDCEGFNTSESRQKSMTKAERTDVAVAFLQEIYDKGYTPMFYAACSELTNNSQWNIASLEKSFKIWVAQYPSTPYPETPSTSYTGTYSMWQYTNQGRVAGIGTNVDINVAYFGYSESNGSLSGETAAAASPDVEAGMVFTSVNDTVTAKDEVRLRDKPSQDTDATVIATLINGETITRTGTSSSGWSRLVYNGQTVYAVTSYLTTDLTPKATESPATGFNTKFTDCNDTVTPKEEVNLRNKPSVTDADSVVVATAKKGEFFTRTGYNTEVGWSRVVYNGQTLYCVTSLLSIQ